MTRMPLFSALICGLFLIGTGDAAELKEFSSVAGKFKVQMPGMPKEDSQKIGEISLNIASVQQGDGAHVVMYSDLPIPGDESAEQIQNRLDGSRDGALRNINATLKKETKVSIGKYAGRDIEADLPNGKGAIHAKFFIVDKRLYQIMSVGTAAFVSSAESMKFLGSFELTK